MIDQSTNLILNVGNVIHDDVCLALSRVNFKELEDTPHSDRVDAAAEKIIAMIEQNVARRLLGDEAVAAVGGRLARGAMFPDQYRKDADYKARTDTLASHVVSAAITAIGITPEGHQS